MADVQPIEFLKLLTARLERLSVDSRFARRASGLRGNMIKVLEQSDAGQLVSKKRVDLLMEAAFEILSRAAQEIPDLENLYHKTK